MEKSSALLKNLQQVRADFGGGVAARKLELLRRLERRRLQDAGSVMRLHETLCFLRAYPDDAEVLAQVEAMLEGFARRRDLRAHRQALADTGIAGTSIHYRFYWIMARWLAERWPNALSIDWAEFDGKSRLQRMLHLLLPYFESPALDELDFSAREWLQRLKGPEETDATFLIERFSALPVDSFLREWLYEHVDTPIRLDPGSDTPSRTRAKYAISPLTFQSRALRRSRPSLRKAVGQPPRSVRSVSPRQGEKLIDLAREAMVTRSRDLDSFAFADCNDVRLTDCGDGLQLAWFGAVPERRLLLEAVYGAVILKNGVPIGYALASALFRSAAIAYNIFETFRGTEAAQIFGRVLASVSQLFAVDTFSIDPFQLGYGNQEGLRSGAWWFYYKLGFRPRDPEVRRTVRAELRNLRVEPGYRSSTATLSRLATEPLFLDLRERRDQVLGSVSLGNISLRVSRYVADRFGSDRERATRTCSREAASLLGLRSLGDLPAGERLAWQRWSPLVMTLPGVEGWSAVDKRALARVARSKGGRRESTYVGLFDGHRRLRRAILKLAEDL